MTNQYERSSPIRILYVGDYFLNVHYFEKKKRKKKQTRFILAIK